MGVQAALGQGARLRGLPRHALLVGRRDAAVQLRDPPRRRHPPAAGPRAHGRVHARRRSTTTSAETRILAWTTTPWTLPSNLALAVGPDIDYAVVEVPDGVRYVLGDGARRASYADGARKAARSSRRCQGATSSGAPTSRCSPTSPATPTRSGCSAPTSSTPTTAPASCTSRPASARTTSGRARPTTSSSVVPGRRRGPLHRRRARVGRRERLRGQPPDHPRPQGSGRRASATTPTTHNYPHCWRTDTPIIYRAMSSAGTSRSPRSATASSSSTRRSTGSPTTCATAPSASGSRRRPRLVDLAQPLLGCAHPGVAQRRSRLPAHRRLRLDRRARARLRRARSPTCTARSSTTSCGRTPTTRPASR